MSRVWVQRLSPLPLEVSVAQQLLPTRRSVPEPTPPPDLMFRGLVTLAPDFLRHQQPVARIRSLESIRCQGTTPARLPTIGSPTVGAQAPRLARQLCQELEAALVNRRPED